MAALVTPGRLSWPASFPLDRRQTWTRRGHCAPSDWSFRNHRSILFLVLLPGCCVFLLLSSSYAPELTIESLRAFVEDYRDGNHSAAARALRDTGLKGLSALSTEFAVALDLKRPADRERLLAGILLLAETALIVDSPEARDLSLDEAVKLTTSMEPDEGIALQKELHLAASYRLFHQRRVMDALQVLEPAAVRYPSDPSLQFAFGTLLELGGWLQSSPALLERARSTYEATLLLDPANSRAALRLGHTLSLLRRYDEAIPRLRDALAADLSLPDRVVGFLSSATRCERPDWRSRPWRPIERRSPSIPIPRQPR